MIEARGRTGRKPMRLRRANRQPRARREPRGRVGCDNPPTWRGAAGRALIAAALVYAVSILLLHQSAGRTIVIFPIVLVVYLPLIYYTDLFLYRRNQRRKQ